MQMALAAAYCSAASLLASARLRAAWTAAALGDAGLRLSFSQFGWTQGALAIKHLA